MKILYAAGPGNIVETYRFWKKGEHDPSQVALTYSEQFYQFCKDNEIQGVAISSNENEEYLADDNFVICNKKTPKWLKQGFSYHLGQIYTSIRLFKVAKVNNCDTVIVSNFNDWFTLAILKPFGIKVIPTLHCTFWTTGTKPNGIKSKILYRLNSWFWKNCVSATLCISPECEKQLREICPNLDSPIIQARPTYFSSSFENIKLPSFNNKEFHIIFAGRIEQNKGIFELYDTAKTLEKMHPGIYKWHICGNGNSFSTLKEMINKEQATDYFYLKGHCSRDRMIQYFSLSNLFIVPTRKDFAEGLNKVAIEGVLSRRPVIVSKYIPATDILGDSVIVAEHLESEYLANLIHSYYENVEKYKRSIASTENVRDIFFDEANGWKASLRKAIKSIN
ncbi:glycosyltransferase family 4 protein [Nitrincola schmidtii]|uniref:glycosyltransferase family 4 protein n=1 Tax=Nitrincola schmidtii TaxID=1730894 RepID=UPI00124C2857|nr:glycosyltransferase family 4 protein [Nitrincola schmidtii]